jgi:ATP-binding cassette subfamily B multidrug efflux pump
VTVGAIALSTGLVIRINNMSGWIMWVVNGIFENVGTVQDGITTISQPRAVQDRDGAMPLEVVAVRCTSKISIFIMASRVV